MISSTMLKNSNLFLDINFQCLCLLGLTAKLNCNIFTISPLIRVLREGGGGGCCCFPFTCAKQFAVWCVCRMFTLASRTRYTNLPCRAPLNRRQITLSITLSLHESNLRRNVNFEVFKISPSNSEQK